MLPTGRIRMLPPGSNHKMAGNQQQSTTSRGNKGKSTVSRHVQRTSHTLDPLFLGLSSTTEEGGSVNSGEPHKSAPRTTILLHSLCRTKAAGQLHAPSGNICLTLLRSRPRNKASRFGSVSLSLGGVRITHRDAYEANPAKSGDRSKKGILSRCLD